MYIEREEQEGLICTGTCSSAPAHGRVKLDPVNCGDASNCIVPGVPAARFASGAAFEADPTPLSPSCPSSQPPRSGSGKCGGATLKVKVRESMSSDHGGDEDEATHTGSTGRRQAALPSIPMTKMASRCEDRHHLPAATGCSSLQYQYLYPSQSQVERHWTRRLHLSLWQTVPALKCLSVCSPRCLMRTMP